MCKDQDRRSPVLAIVSLTALLTLGAGVNLSPAIAGSNDCIKLEAFSANIAKRGGTASLLPAASFAKARKLLDLTPGHSAIEADAAYFDEMPDGSSGITFGSKGCVSAVWLTPPFVPRASLKALLFEEKPQPGPAPDERLAWDMHRA